VGGEVRYYSVEEAARLLRLTPERVRELLEAGEIEGIPTAGGERWMIPIRGDVSVPPPPVTAVPAEPPTGHSEGRDLPEEPGEPGEPPATIEDARQPAELSRGEVAANDAASIREPTSESGWVTTQQAARALGISARTVRWHIEQGNLEAKPEGEGVERAWRVSVDSLQTFRDSRQLAAPLPRSSRALETGADIAAESPGNAIRELADRLVEEARRAEAARVRLELSERAQSTLEAELSEERRRREEAEKERDAARRELAILEDRKEAAVEPKGASQSAAVGPGEVSTAEAAAGALRPPEGSQETPAPGLGTDAAGGGSRRQAPPRWWRRWRRS
jgi:excisionase family DNA binding protein